MRKTKQLISFFPALTLFVTMSLWAQTSQVNGRVYDSSQASISSARITLLRGETGEKRQAVTSQEGYYSFPLLIPGIYEAKVEKDGFQPVTRTGIKVETGNISTVDFELEVGVVTQEVTVEAQVPLLQTGTSAIAQIVENQTIVNMPLVDRRSSQLTRLSGFVVQNGAGSGATFAIAGGRGNNANYLIDGGTAQNLTLGVATLSFDPPVESMQEFNVAVSNYAAELGRTGGGVIQMTTKSGTNNFHGSAYEYFRNDALNTRTFFARAKPVLRYNLFGASLGGPIVKNKTHFFFNYEGRRQVVQTTNTLNVPTVAETQGDFSANSARVIDPLTRNPFPGNVVPAARLDAVGSKIAGFFPVPNVPGAASGRANFVANVPAVTPVNVYVGRVDHAFSLNDRIFVRSLNQIDKTTTASIFRRPGTDTFGNLSDNTYYNASGTWYHSFKPTLINEARFTYTRRQALAISAGANSNLAQSIGLKGVNSTFGPTVVVTGLQQIGNNQQQRLQVPIRSDQWADNLTYMRGAHQVKFGFEYRYSRNLDSYSPSAGGNFTFNNVATGSSLASLLLGWVSSASVLETYPLETRADSYATFIQDDWRITPKLTVNLGLRYDIDQPRWEKKNRQNGFDPFTNNPVSNTPGIVTFSGRNGLSKYANRWDKNNFGPRLGFAYKATGAWVIRGGASLLYTGQYDQATPIVANLGFSKQGNFVSPDGGLTPAFLLVNGVPAVFAPGESDLTAGFGAVSLGTRPTTAPTFFQPGRSNGYLWQGNLDIQHEFRGNWMVDIGYLGTFGHHLPAPDAMSINQVPASKLAAGNMQANRPFPQFSNVQIIAADIGHSNYHGLNLGVDKRYAKGFSLRANYTFAKFIDNLAARNELAGSPGTGAFIDYYNQRANRGLAGNDIRHRFIGSTVYELPFGHGKRFDTGRGLADALAGGWSLSFIGELRTGTPLNAIMLNNQTNSFSDGVRPNVTGNPIIDGSRGKNDQLAKWFNTSAFAAPALYTFGNAGRNFGAGPGAINFDGSLMKDFRLRERMTLQFRAESLNFLNHANFANPDTRFGSATFGQITGLIAGNQSRILQFGLHLKF